MFQNPKKFKNKCFAAQITNVKEWNKEFHDLPSQSLMYSLTRGLFYRELKYCNRSFPFVVKLLKTIYECYTTERIN